MPLYTHSALGRHHSSRDDSLWFIAFMERWTGASILNVVIVRPFAERKNSRNGRADCMLLRHHSNNMWVGKFGLRLLLPPLLFIWSNPRIFSHIRARVKLDHTLF